MSRRYERHQDGYHVITTCHVCGDKRTDVVKTDQDLSQLEVDTLVFDATNEAGWRWFGAFHKCKQCIKGRK